jgi:peptidoglycan/LPS O-acetylase OafA/YrhL
VTQVIAAPLAAEKGRSPKGFSYRPDIDGLRGFAVLAVFLYHLNGRWLPGGFTGVDVFFVISGYVVTGSLLAHQQEPLGPRLAGFYLRRMRRLLPNLFCSIGVTALGVALLVPPRETRGLFNSAVKALYGWSNNYFAAKSSDYFGLDSSLNPFAHTWSLGVEEQFYLVFPLLLALLCLAGGRRALALLLAIMAASFALSLHGTWQAPMQAFFRMPSRFWELAAGAALLWAQRQGLTQGWPAGRGLRLGAYGLLLVAVFFTPEREGFPAPGALVAVLAALAFIQAGHGDGRRFLPWPWLERPLVACGLLSYSLYLWHWPIITFLRWTYGLDRPWLYLLATGLSFGLAMAAYLLVERPARRHPLPGPWQLGLTVAALGLTWAGIDGLANPWRGRLFAGPKLDPVPPQELPWQYNGLDRANPLHQGACNVAVWSAYDRRSQANFSLCRKRGSQGEVFLLGDSHGQALLPLLDAVTAETGQALSYTFKSACLISSELTISYVDGKRYGPCRAFAAGEIERSLQRLKPGDTVIIASWFNQQLLSIDGTAAPRHLAIHQGSNRLTDLQARAAYVKNLRDWAQRFKAKGLHLVLVVDVPLLKRDLVACDGWASLLPPPQRASFCAPEASITKAMQATVRSSLLAAAKGLDNVHVFDPTGAFMRDGRVQHRSPEGDLLYVDFHHLSVSGSRSLKEPLLAFMRREGLIRSSAK